MTTNSRSANFPIDPMFLERWSPRAFTGEEIAEADLLTILEAARWAASAFNAQPWRFVYSRRNTASWSKLLDLLIPFNQSWASHASALVYVLSKTVMRKQGSTEDSPSYSHSFDAGAATGNFALQANRMGWFVHGMTGFDVERAYRVLGIPNGYRIEAVFAVGRRGTIDNLPDFLRARELPSDRVPLSELAFEGSFTR